MFLLRIMYVCIKAGKGSTIEFFALRKLGHPDKNDSNHDKNDMTTDKITAWCPGLHTLQITISYRNICDVLADDN